MADKDLFSWNDGNGAPKDGDFADYMFAEGNGDLDRRCAEHFKEESFINMRDTHMKTDDNSYLSMKDDHDVEVYKKAYAEGYEAGWRRCLLVCNKIWYEEAKKRGDFGSML